MPHEVERRVIQFIDSVQNVTCLARDREGIVRTKVHTNTCSINDHGPVSRPDELARRSPRIMTVTKITVNQDNCRPFTSTV
jgi:hypothetical protein